MVASRPTVSRRQLLGASGAAGAAFGLAACGGSPSRAAPRVARLPKSIASADEALLNRLIEVENHAAAAYIASIPLLSDHNLRAAKHFLHQELSHAAELIAAIRTGGGKPQGPPTTYDLGQPQGTKQVMELLHSVERRSIDAYLYSIPKLPAGPLRAVAASILANEAQHIAIVRRNLGLDPVPAPFVTGAE